MSVRLVVSPSWKLELHNVWRQSYENNIRDSDKWNKGRFMKQPTLQFVLLSKYFIMGINQIKESLDMPVI
jgi:hypothetical protein